MRAPNFPMAALHFLCHLLGRAGLGVGRALQALALLIGVHRSLSRDPAIDAWQALTRRRRLRHGRRGCPRPRTMLPSSGIGRGSVDDPHVRLRITM